MWREELAEAEGTAAEKTEKVLGKNDKGEDDIKEEALNAKMDEVH